MVEFTKGDKNILIMSDDFPPESSASSKWAYNLSKFYTKNGYRVCVIAGYDKKRGKSFGETDEIIHIEKEDGKITPSSWEDILDAYLATHQKPGYVIAASWNCAYGIRDICKKEKLKYSIVIPGFVISNEITLFNRGRLKSALQESSLIVTSNKFTKHTIAKDLGVPRKNISVIPDGVDTEKFRRNIDPDFRTQNDTTFYKVLMTLSYITEGRGQETVIRAMPLIMRHFENLKYFICGSWDEKHYVYLKKLAEKLQIEDKVIFTGRVSDEAIPMYYNLCDIYVKPSHIRLTKETIQGFGSTYFEASACEKPIIAGNDPGVTEAVVHNSNGFLVNPKVVRDVADKITYLLKTPKHLQRMGRYGRERVVQKYSWDAVVKQIDSIMFNAMK